MSRRSIADAALISQWIREQLPAPAPAPRPILLEREHEEVPLAA